MPFALILVGLLLIVTAIRGTQSNLWNLVYGDLTGKGSTSKGFIVWLAAILIIGFIGYYKPLRVPSRMLLALVVLGIFISNQGVLTKMSAAFTSPLPQPATPVNVNASQPLPQAIPVSVSGAGGKGGSGASGVLGDASAVLGTVSKIIPFFA
jgi:hypothetical protein